METHVKVLAVLYIVFGALGILGALAVMAVFGVAGIATAAAVAGDPDAAIALPIIGLTGTALAVFLLLVSVPGVIAGIGLLKYRPWARILTIVLSVINLLRALEDHHERHSHSPRSVSWRARHRQLSGLVRVAAGESRLRCGVSRGRASRVARCFRYLSIDRRPAAHQRAGDIHDHQRIADAARGARRHGRGLQAVRAPR